MKETKKPNRWRMVYTPQEIAQLPQGQPYLYYVVYSDWTDANIHILHKHEDIIEILVILEGKGTCHVGQRRYDVQAGDVMIFNAMVLHDEFPQMEEAYQTMCMGIKGLKLPELAENHLISDDRCPIFHGMEEYHDLVALFRMMERYLAERCPRYQEMCRHLMYAAIDLTQNMIENSKNRPIPFADTVCTQVMKYIDLHYAENLTLEQISQLFYISPYHLAHIFKRFSGYTLKQYILR